MKWFYLTIDSLRKTTRTETLPYRAPPASLALLYGVAGGAHAHGVCTRMVAGNKHAQQYIKTKKEGHSRLLLVARTANAI